MWGLVRNESKKLLKSKKFLILCIIFIIVIIYANTSVVKDIKSLNPEIKRMNNTQMIIRLTKQLETDKKLNQEDRINIESQIKRLTEENLILSDEMVASVKDWRKSSEKKIQMLEGQKKDIFALSNKNVMENLNAQIKKYKYYLENNMIPEKDYKIYSFSAMVKIISTINLLFIPIFIVFLGADIISGEYSNSTIKMLLTKPVSRTRIVISKYVTSCIIILTIIILSEAINFIILGFKYEFGNINNPVVAGTRYIFDSHKNITAAVLNSSSLWSAGKVLLSSIALQILFILALTSLVVLISVIITNNVSSLIISFMFTVILNLMTFIMPQPALRILYPFLLSTYGNAPQLITGEVVTLLNNPIINVRTGIIVMSLYAILSMVFSIFIFRKKDILI